MNRIAILVPCDLLDVIGEGKRLCGIYTGSCNKVIIITGPIITARPGDRDRSPGPVHGSLQQVAAVSLAPCLP